MRAYCFKDKEITEQKTIGGAYRCCKCGFEFRHDYRPKRKRKRNRNGSKYNRKGIE